MASRSGSKGSETTAKSKGPGARRGTPDVLGEAATRAGLGAEAVEALTTWLTEQLENDRFARLEQAGHSVEGKIPLARVFIDLEVSSGSPEHTAPGSDAGKGFVRSVLGLKPTRLTERARHFPSGDPRGPRGRELRRHATHRTQSTQDREGHESRDQEPAPSGGMGSSVSAPRTRRAFVMGFDAIALREGPGPFASRAKPGRLACSATGRC